MLFDLLASKRAECGVETTDLKLRFGYCRVDAGAGGRPGCPQLNEALKQIRGFSALGLSCVNGYQCCLAIAGQRWIVEIKKAEGVLTGNRSRFYDALVITQVLEHLVITGVWNELVSL